MLDGQGRLESYRERALREQVRGQERERHGGRADPWNIYKHVEPVDF